MSAAHYLCFACNIAHEPHLACPKLETAADIPADAFSEAHDNDADLPVAFVTVYPGRPRFGAFYESETVARKIADGRGRVVAYVPLARVQLAQRLAMADEARELVADTLPAPPDDER